MKRVLLIGTFVGATLTLDLGAQDARAVIDAASKTMGAASLQGVSYSAAGSSYSVGQNYSPGGPWPRFTVTKYDAVINFGTQMMREEFVRVDDEKPPRGGGAGPYVPETQQGGIRPIPFGPQTTRALRDGRTENGGVQLLLTPFGFLKGAAASNATVRAGRNGAQLVSFTAFNGKYTFTGTLNAQNLVEKVETKVSNPMYGDVALEAEYSNYRDLNGIRFPMRIVQRQLGYPTFDLRVSAVQPNSEESENLAVPPRPAAAAGGEAAARATAKELAPGFWALEGAIPMSFLIEFNDFVIVVEAPGNEQRTEAMLAEVKRVTPNKPIRYVVNTHHHSDHSGGLRAVVAEGIPILTHERNKAYYEKLFRGPSQVVPDKLSRAPRAPIVEGVGDKRVITDGTRTVELYHLRGNLHADSLLVVYLPKERMLLQADAFAPRPPGAKPLPSSPYTTNLLEHVRDRKLDVAQLVHVHGGMDPLSALVEVANRRGTN
jgi:glyoxylase-like metal-dependent hydrolase (beta-lactamase superfamily II)